MVLFSSSFFNSSIVHKKCQCCLSSAAYYVVRTDQQKDIPLSVTDTGIIFQLQEDYSVEVTALDVISGLSQEYPGMIYVPDSIIHGQACAVSQDCQDGNQLAQTLAEDYQGLQATLNSLFIVNQPVISHTVLPHLYEYIFGHLPAMNGPRLRELIRQAMQRAMVHYLPLFADTSFSFEQADANDQAIKLWLMFVYWLNKLAKGTLPHDNEVLLLHGFNAGIEEGSDQQSGFNQVTTASINSLFENSQSIQYMVDDAGDFVVNVLLKKITSMKKGTVLGVYIDDRFGTLYIYRQQDGRFQLITPTGLIITAIDDAALRQVLDELFGQITVNSSGVRRSIWTAPRQFPGVRAVSPGGSQLVARPSSTNREYFFAVLRGAVGTAMGGAVIMFISSRLRVGEPVLTLLGLFGGIGIGLISMAGTPLDSFGIARLLSALRLVLSGASYRGIR